MSVAKFRITLPHERITATVEVDRISGLVRVRPYRRRRTYELHLGDVAEMIAWRVAKAEAAEKRRERRRK